MTDATKTERQRNWRRRKDLGLVVHRVETKPALIPEIDRINRELLEREREQDERPSGGNEEGNRPPEG